MRKLILLCFISVTSLAAAQDTVYKTKTTHYSDSEVVRSSQTTTVTDKLTTTQKVKEVDAYRSEKYGQVQKIFHLCGDVKLLDSMIVYGDEGVITRLTAYEYDAECRRTRQMHWHTYNDIFKPLIDKQIEHVADGVQVIKDYFYQDGEWNLHSTTDAYLQYDEHNNLERYEILVYKGDSLHTHQLEQMTYSGPRQLRSRKVTNLKTKTSTALAQYNRTDPTTTVASHYQDPDGANRLVKRDTIYNDAKGNCSRERYYSANCAGELELVKTRDHSTTEIATKSATPKDYHLEVELTIVPTQDHVANITITDLVESEQYTLQVFDISGRLLRTTSIQNVASYQLEVAAQGVIIARVTSAKGQYAQEKSVLP